MFHQVTAHTWYLEPDGRSDRPAAGYIRGSRYAFAVEACASPAHVKLFYDQLRQNGLPLPDFTGISHYHWDHSYGACAVHGVTIASDKCNALLRREAAWGWSEKEMQQRVKDRLDIQFCYVTRKIEYPDPTQIRVIPADMEITGNMAIDLGGVEVQLLYCGGPHSEDHLIFYVPQDRVLYLSDAAGKDLHLNEWVYDENDPEAGWDQVDRLPHFKDRLLPFYHQLECLDFSACITGHGDRVLSKKDILDSLRPYL